MSSQRQPASSRAVRSRTSLVALVIGTAAVVSQDVALAAAPLPRTATGQ